MGEYSADLFNGEGELKTSGGVYKGHFKDGLRDGIGVMQFKSNCRYEGHWSKGRFHGRYLMAIDPFYCLLSHSHLSI